MIYLSQIRKSQRIAARIFPQKVVPVTACVSPHSPGTTLAVIEDPTSLLAMVQGRVVESAHLLVGPIVGATFT